MPPYDDDHHDPDISLFTTRTFSSSDESTPSPIQQHIDTLFAEFTRSRPGRSSPSRSPTTYASGLRSSRHGGRRLYPDTPQHVDLRALDYVSEYDSHLMCPICHVPFVNPVVLDCDHTFCASCFEEYREGATSSDRSRCPTCRTYLLASPRKASRLIINMCNDIKVCCPNEDCDMVLTRGCVEQHSTKDCPEGKLDCPDTDCEKKVKRKNFVPNQCIHSSHIECDCGAVIELGRGEWLKHKDEDCPTTGVKCESCGERISVKDYLAGRGEHICKDKTAAACPGAEYGCSHDPASASDLETHTKSCPFARLAPVLKKQSTLLNSLTTQLIMTKLRNETLETNLDKLSTLLHDRVLPSLPNQSRNPDHGDMDLEIEEIDRQSHPIPSATMHRDLLLPAHLRTLTPSPPPPDQANNMTNLLSLYDTLSATVQQMSTDITGLHRHLSDLDARTSMSLMNETLRIKEDLAHTNAAVFSTRAQVQWLLNRERVGQQAAIMRGRAPSHQGQASSSNSAHVQGSSNQAVAGSSSATNSQRSSIDGNSEAGASTGGVGVVLLPGMGETGQSSSFSAAATASPRVRPVMRRLSGGSQERVKL